jgi:hypothetical protein
VIPDVQGYNRRLVVFVHEDSKPVRQHELLTWDTDLLRKGACGTSSKQAATLQNRARVNVLDLSCIFSLPIALSRQLLGFQVYLSGGPFHACRVALPQTDRNKEAWLGCLKFASPAGRTEAHEYLLTYKSQWGRVVPGRTENHLPMVFPCAACTISAHHKTLSAACGSLY